MTSETHAQTASFIWSLRNLLLGHEPPRDLEAIEADTKALGGEIMTVLAEVTT